MNERQNRIAFLDGLRGLAIALVVLFHAYARWAGIIPFGRSLASLPLFSYGWVGVQIFFMISGYVILMTLERSSGVVEFCVKRWLRLFPAMAACSLIIYVTSPLFPERPLGTIALRDLLPGLTFIEPSWWGTLLGSPQGMIEGVFWSLFVEVKFYVVFALLYYFVGQPSALLTLVLLFAMAVGPVSTVVLDPDGAVAGTLRLTSAEHFGWFAAGALYYLFHKTQKPVFVGYAVAVAGISALTIRNADHSAKCAAVMASLVFFLAATSRGCRHLLANRVLLFLGFVSYPLYLIHENMTVALIVKVGRGIPWLPRPLVPALPILAVTALAWLIAAVIEPWMRGLIRAPWRHVFHALPHTAATPAAIPVSSRKERP